MSFRIARMSPANSADALRVALWIGGLLFAAVVINIAAMLAIAAGCSCCFF